MCPSVPHRRRRWDAPPAALGELSLDVAACRLAPTGPKYIIDGPVTLAVQAGKSHASTGDRRTPAPYGAKDHDVFQISVQFWRASAPGRALFSSLRERIPYPPPPCHWTRHFLPKCVVRSCAPVGPSCSWRSARLRRLEARPVDFQQLYMLRPRK